VVVVVVAEPVQQGLELGDGLGLVGLGGQPAFEGLLEALSWTRTLPPLRISGSVPLGTEPERFTDLIASSTSQCLVTYSAASEPTRGSAMVIPGQVDALLASGSTLDGSRNSSHT
jgi:hypothetical protein